MTEKITLRKLNDAYMKIEADMGIILELKEKLTFYVPGYKHMPLFKAKQWDGTVSMVKLPSCTILVGLLKEVMEFCKARSYECYLEGFDDAISDVSAEVIKTFVSDLNIHSRGVKLEVRDYQLNAIYKSIKYKRLTVLSPTASGKSCIIYAVMRYLLEEHDKPVLVIVPNVGLVKQMRGDFIDYSSNNGFDAESNVQTIAEGSSKDVSRKIVISTWQSIQGLLKNKIQTQRFLNQFQGIILDECHQAAAKVLGSIMEAATDVPYRLGFTGTLDGAKAHEYTIQGLFGAVIRVAKTSELIEQGHVSKMIIRCLSLNYKDKEEQSLLRDADYQTEIMFLSSHEKRNRLLINLALSNKGNVLLLYSLVERHGKPLYKLAMKMLEERGDSRKVFLIHGGVDGEDRDKMRSIVENEDNALIIGSYQTLSTGTSIKRLHHVIAGAPTKSIIRLLQSMGRGLRLGKDKDTFTWWDISDKIYCTKGGKSNHTWGHFQTRLQIYVEQDFEYRIIEKDI